MGQVDAHQDVLTPQMCGEGLPDWLVAQGLDLVGFNTSADPARAFPAPLPFALDYDPATGYPTVGTSPAELPRGDLCFPRHHHDF